MEIRVNYSFQPSYEVFADLKVTSREGKMWQLPGFGERLKAIGKLSLFSPGRKKNKIAIEKMKKRNEGESIIF